MVYCLAQVPSLRPSLVRQVLRAAGQRPETSWMPTRGDTCMLAVYGAYGLLMSLEGSAVAGASVS